MSRTGQRQPLRPRHLEGNDGTNESSASTRNHADGADLQENHRVPLSPEQSSSSVAEDDVDGDISSSERTFGCAFTNFRSRDFQDHFQNSRSHKAFSITSPLPRFSWADSGDVWRNMLKKETIYLRDPGLFRNHPELHPRMRSILLDWLSEVCEVNHLHKETFTLAQDFVDRYLSVTKAMPKTQLQLLGVTALFLASKLEEVYPPKLPEFAYVTDSACTESDIIRQELILVKALKWEVAPMTTNAWLGVFLQVANIEHITDQDLGFVFPQFSTHAFIQLSRLCDLSLMDPGSLYFRYSIIAASALYHHTSEHLVADVSGLTWADIYPCVKWMAPFARAILDVGQSPAKFFTHVPTDDSHNIQTHNVDMALVDRALAHQAVFQEKEKQSPSSLDLSAQLVSLLVPPDDEVDDDDDDESPDVSMGDECSSSS